MGNLKYAILGLLNQKDMTGYELMKEFESSLKEFWYAKHSQIYPELKKLTDGGLVTYQVEISGTSLEKKLYRITDAGRKDFLGWLKAETPAEHTPKEVFRLKIFYSGFLSPDGQRAMLEENLRQHEERLRHLQKNQEKFTAVPERNSAAFGDYLVLLGAVMREETTCEWLKKCLGLLQ